MRSQKMMGQEKRRSDGIDMPMRRSRECAEEMKERRMRKIYIERRGSMIYIARVGWCGGFMRGMIERQEKARVLFPITKSCTSCLSQPPCHATKMLML